MWCSRLACRRVPHRNPEAWKKSRVGDARDLSTTSLLRLGRLGTWIPGDTPNAELLTAEDEDGLPEVDTVDHPRGGIWQSGREGLHVGAEGGAQVARA
jgi:hypothetical protein